MSHDDHHGHDHSHGHVHLDPADPGSTRALWWTLVLVVGYAGAEVIGGRLSGSLALLADAGHMVSDAAAIGITLFASWYARRPPTPTRTYGHYRAEILAALANGATLVVIAIFIIAEAGERLATPHVIDGPMMLGIAVGGLLVNAAGLWLLHGGSSGSLNVHGAWLHVLTDALGSVQAIVAAALSWAFGWTWVDPIASVLIALLVIYSAWSLLRQSVAVLMEGTPSHIDVDAVETSLMKIAGVDGIHDLHVWAITSSFVALSAHILIGTLCDAARVLRAAESTLLHDFGIRHTTLQIDVGGACQQACRGVSAI